MKRMGYIFIFFLFSFLYGHYVSTKTLSNLNGKVIDYRLNVIKLFLKKHNHYFKKEIQYRGKHKRKIHNHKKIIQDEKKDNNNHDDKNERNNSLNIIEFEQQDIKINKKLNVNIFKKEKERNSDDINNFCLYNLLKNIEIEDIKNTPIYNPEFSNVIVKKENNEIILSENKENDYLENSLIYKDTNYELPQALKYYPDDMFFFNFDGVISLNKQEKVVVAFLTFLKVFNQSFIFNGKEIQGLPLYNYVRKEFFFFDNLGKSENVHLKQKITEEKKEKEKEAETEKETDKQEYITDINSNEKRKKENNDPFILLKLIPKFFYSRLLYNYKYLKTNADIVIAAKYMYDEINNICEQFNYDINEILKICEKKNKIANMLKMIKEHDKTRENKIEKKGEIKKDNINNNNNNHNHNIKDPINEEDHINVYDVTSEMTKHTFNPFSILEYKKIENLVNVFPSFRFDFENFYLNNTNLKLYKKYKIDINIVQKEFDNMRNVLRKFDKEAYDNLLKYRYACDNVKEKNRKDHETINTCAIDVINHNIHVFKKPIYIISTVEDTNFIKYNMELFGIKLKTENEHLLRIFGRDTLNQIEKKKNFNEYNRQEKIEENEQKEETQTKQGFISNIQKLWEKSWFGKTEEQKVDYIYDPYNMDIDYLNYFQKTKKKDYYFKKNLNYMNMLKQKCDLIHFIINKFNKFHADNPIHIMDHKYDDLNALNNDSRINNKIKLYFCEWGYNTYTDKLKAIYNDKIKTFSQTFKLIYLCCTYQNSPRRKYTHGKGIPQDFYSKFIYKYCLKNNLITEVDPFVQF